MKILCALVIYPSPFFNIFLLQSIKSIQKQTLQDFTLLLFLDGISQNSIHSIYDFCTKNTIIIEQQESLLSPSEIRQNIINYAYENNYNYLLFADFDETMEKDRIEKTLPYLQEYSFTYCNAHITNFNLQKIIDVNFQDLKKIPKHISELDVILDKNCIGLGGLALNLNTKTLYNLHVPKTIQSYDWFIATHMLLNGLNGVAAYDVFVNYRQHITSYVGTNQQLTADSLKLGIAVKKWHYHYFSQFNAIFHSRLQQIQELENYLEQNEKKYIKIINQNFNLESMWWWENIKTLEEIKQWI